MSIWGWGFRAGGCWLSAGRMVIVAGNTCCFRRSLWGVGWASVKLNKSLLQSSHHWVPTSSWQPCSLLRFMSVLLQQYCWGLAQPRSITPGPLHVSARAKCSRACLTKCRESYVHLPSVGTYIGGITCTWYLRKCSTIFMCFMNWDPGLSES